MELAKNIHSIASAPRFNQFLSVGVAGAIIDNVALLAFVEFISLEPLLSKVIAAEIAIIIMFLINDKWTFSDFGSDNMWSLFRRFAKSNVVRSGGVGVALLTLFVLHNILGVWYLAANIVGIGGGFFVNYCAESLFTWRVQQ
ncbi:GtrA family protein [Natronosalvus rutilus]|uniref:GtrA family protein n=1 Tax=Natronosalvus rutilus TaxID=2953753 RepID=A0A9E7N6R5_9EURY|nr:GtrA family protein [Natronosalvus rutilus]UTF52739.1 GtrA family protein [Natronosalvus rutilus]